MGSLFKTPRTRAGSLLTPSQERLLEEVLNVAGERLASSGIGFEGLASKLSRSTAPQGQALGERIFREGLLAPALRSFDEEIDPRIRANFAGIGGSLSSRLADTRARLLEGVMTNAQAGLASTLPTALSFPLSQTLAQIQGLGALEDLRFRAPGFAAQVATTPTRQFYTQPAGPGWGILNSGLQALTTYGVLKALD